MKGQHYDMQKRYPLILVNEFWGRHDFVKIQSLQCLSAYSIVLFLLSGMEGIECSLPLDGRRIPLSLLSEDSFRECRGTLTLTDYLIVIFSGISVSVAAIMASFFLASTVHCFQRLSKGGKGDEEEGNDWWEGDMRNCIAQNASVSHLLRARKLSQVFPCKI